MLEVFWHLHLNCLQCTGGRSLIERSGGGDDPVDLGAGDLCPALNALCLGVARLAPAKLQELLRFLICVEVARRRRQVEKEPRRLLALFDARRIEDKRLHLPGIFRRSRDERRDYAELAAVRPGDDLRDTLGRDGYCGHEQNKCERQ